MHYRIRYDATWIDKAAFALTIPVLRREREGRGIHLIADAS
jgi:hypothetical protein